MTGQQIVFLALIVAAFAAGWIARGERKEDDGAGGEEEGARDASASGPDPARDAGRALALAAAAYENAVDRWLDERDAITPAGRAAVGELERAVQRLDHAAARVDEVDDVLGDAAYDALEALRKAVRHLGAFREGRAIDAPTSRELDRLEDEVARARGAFEAAPT